MATMNIFKHAEQYLSFTAGQLIFYEGQPGRVMYVVKEGRVDIMVNDRLIETVGPGGVIGEMALIDDSVRSGTAIAQTDCKLVPIDEMAFFAFVHQTPFFAIQVMRVMADRLRHMNELQQ